MSAGFGRAASCGQQLIWCAITNPHQQISASLVVLRPLAMNAMLPSVCSIRYCYGLSASVFDVSAHDVAPHSFACFRSQATAVFVIVMCRGRGSGLARSEASQDRVSVSVRCGPVRVGRCPGRSWADNHLYELAALVGC